MYHCTQPAGGFDAKLRQLVAGEPTAFEHQAQVESREHETHELAAVGVEHVADCSARADALPTSRPPSSKKRDVTGLETSSADEKRAMTAAASAEGGVVAR